MRNSKCGVVRRLGGASIFHETVANGPVLSRGLDFSILVATYSVWIVLKTPCHFFVRTIVQVASGSRD